MSWRNRSVRHGGEGVLVLLPARPEQQPEQVSDLVPQALPKELSGLTSGLPDVRRAEEKVSCWCSRARAGGTFRKFTDEADQLRCSGSIWKFCSSSYLMLEGSQNVFSYYGTLNLINFLKY